jgi:mRNA interferase MazF
MVIRKGSIYWIDFSPGKGSEPRGRRPGLVMQNDALNDSKINTIIVVAITSNMKFGEAPGNVVLRKGEANMPKACVVNATQIKSVDRSSLRGMIGALSRKRMDEVEAGIRLVMDLKSGGTFH